MILEVLKLTLQNEFAFVIIIYHDVTNANIQSINLTQFSCH
jgi:hypothetical protein